MKFTRYAKIRNAKNTAEFELWDEPLDTVSIQTELSTITISVKNVRNDNGLGNYEGTLELSIKELTDLLAAVAERRTKEIRSLLMKGGGTA
ncbi:hypothetical protein LX70_02333 [Defluviimonas denitrificans]|jgi:spore coat protein CotH|uniref:Uncharacterized protein n=1 Tax=Albidovulum denitrificans TaxID=404881 RepID=A0A2S8S7L4_9RHOB|nr:hypothetical protein [Defluviimonas denitrificans]PQV56759.1 hypothetical protein LX70_02333 [Defluviimonas denitrificans]